MAYAHENRRNRHEASRAAPQTQGRACGFDAPSGTTVRRELEARLQASFAKRQQWIMDSESSICQALHRLVDDAGDALPGLVIDRYGAYARIEYYGPFYERLDRVVRECLTGVHPDIAGVTSILRMGQGRVKILHDTNPNEDVAVIEREADPRRARSLWVKLNVGHAAGSGVFFDQRLTRDALMAHVSERAEATQGQNDTQRLSDPQNDGDTTPYSMLNLFAHAGGFGAAVVAASGQHGVTLQIDHVDAARKAASWAAQNYAENGGDPKAHRFIVDDVFKFVRRMVKQQRTYDAIVCDPPVFAKGAARARGSAVKAQDHLWELAESCLELLAPGGFLCFACNDRSLTHKALRALFQEAETRGDVTVEKMPLGVDFTALAMPNLVSTKGVWVRSARKQADITR